MSFHNFTTDNFCLRCFTPEIDAFLQKIAQKQQLIIVIFGTPYLIQHLQNLPTILCVYQNLDFLEQETAKFIFEKQKINSHLPFHFEK